MITIIDSVTANGISEPIPIPPIRQTRGGSVPFQIHGIIDATVIFEGILADSRDDLVGGQWSPIANAVFASDTCDGLFVMFSFIRVKVVSYVAGSITVKVEV